MRVIIFIFECKDKNKFWGLWTKSRKLFHFLIFRDSCFKTIGKGKHIFWGLWTSFPKLFHFHVFGNSTLRQWIWWIGELGESVNFAIFHFLNLQYIWRWIFLLSFVIIVLLLFSYFFNKKTTIIGFPQKHARFTDSPNSPNSPIFTFFAISSREKM